MWAIGVARTPIPKNQWPVNTVEVEGTPTHHSVALGRWPVNHFQTEAAVNFRNHNGNRVPAVGAQNGVRKIAIFLGFSTTIPARSFCQNFCECKAIKNSFHANSGQI